MINVTNKFRQALFDDKRDYLEYVDITLANGTKLNLTNEHLWDGGIEIEDATLSDSSFDIGSAIINSCQITINNIYDDFSDYDFGGAKVFAQVGLQFDDGTIENVPKGTFTVDEATYNGAIISLSCLDNMSKFDKPYSESKLAYPATLDEIVRNVCSVCGVPFSANSLNFPHKNYSIAVRPDDESTTCREVLSYVAQIAGCFARCNASGELELKWYDQESFEVWQEGYDGGEFDSAKPYSTGHTLNGGTFNPWNTGAVADGGVFTGNNQIHYISGLYQSSISVDDVVITGVRITVKLDDEDKSSKDFTKGTTGYEIAISDNPMITEVNGQEIVNWLGTQLIGLKFRKATVSHSSDPTIEAGDIAVIWDRKSNGYPIFVTRTNFKVGGSQTTVCGAETPARNSSTRYSLQTKNNVELRKKLEKQKSTYDQAMEELEKRLDNANGLYATEVTTDNGGKITYLHNKPNPRTDEGVFEFPSESDIVIMISTAGVVVTNEGNKGGKEISDRNWYGIEINGKMIASILQTIGLNFDWGTGGTLTLGGKNNGNGVLRVLDAYGNQIGTWNNTGITINKGAIQGSDIKVGGASNKDGKITVYDASGNEIGTWNKDGLTVTQGSINGGLITAGKIQSTNKRVYFDLDNNEISANKITNKAVWANGNVTLDTTLDSTYTYTKGYLKIYNSAFESGVLRLAPGYNRSGSNKAVIAGGKGLCIRYGTIHSSSIYEEEKVPEIIIDEDSISLWSKGYDKGGYIDLLKDGYVFIGRTIETYNLIMTGTFTYKGSVVNPSDIRLKKNVKKIDTRYLNAISKVELQEYEYKDVNETRFGAVAQEVIESLEHEGLDWKNSSIVRKTKLKHDDDEFYGLNYIEFLMIRVASDEKIIQEQKQEIDNLKQQVNELQSKLDKVLALLEI